MFPTVGYFRGVQCPDDKVGSSCSRPFCHFYHKNQVAEENSAATSGINLVQNDKVGSACSTSSSSAVSGGQASIFHHLVSEVVKKVLSESQLLANADINLNSSAFSDILETQASATISGVHHAGNTRASSFHQTVPTYNPTPIKILEQKKQAEAKRRAMLDQVKSRENTVCPDEKDDEMTDFSPPDDDDGSDNERRCQSEFDLLEEVLAEEYERNQSLVPHKRPRREVQHRAHSQSKPVEKTTRNIEPMQVAETSTVESDISENQLDTSGTLCINDTCQAFDESSSSIQQNAVRSELLAEKADAIEKNVPKKEIKVEKLEETDILASRRLLPSVISRFSVSKIKQLRPTTVGSKDHAEAEESQLMKTRSEVSETSENGARNKNVEVVEPSGTVRELNKKVELSASIQTEQQNKEACLRNNDKCGNEIVDKEKEIQEVQENGRKAGLLDNDAADNGGTDEGKNDLSSAEEDTEGSEHHPSKYSDRFDSCDSLSHGKRKQRSHSRKRKRHKPSKSETDDSDSLKMKSREVRKKRRHNRKHSHSHRKYRKHRKKSHHYHHKRYTRHLSEDTGEESCLGEERDSDSNSEVDPGDIKQENECTDVSIKTETAQLLVSNSLKVEKEEISQLEPEKCYGATKGTPVKTEPLVKVEMVAVKTEKMESGIVREKINEVEETHAVHPIEDTNVKVKQENEVLKPFGKEGKKLDSESQESVLPEKNVGNVQSQQVSDEKDDSTLRQDSVGVEQDKPKPVSMFDIVTASLASQKPVKTITGVSIFDVPGKSKGDEKEKIKPKKREHSDAKDQHGSHSKKDHHSSRRSHHSSHSKLRDSKVKKKPSSKGKDEKRSVHSSKKEKEDKEKQVTGRKSEKHTNHGRSKSSSTSKEPEHRKSDKAKSKSSSPHHSRRHSNSTSSSKHKEKSKNCPSKKSPVNNEEKLDASEESPPPDLSALNDLLSEEWDHLIDDEDSQNCDAGTLASEDHISECGDADDITNPEVLEECMRFFDDYQPEVSDSKDSIKKAQAKEPDSELIVGKQRQAHPGASGNLLHKGSSRNTSYKTPMQIMLERFEKLKGQQQELEKKLEKQKLELEAYQAKCSSSKEDGSQVVSSSSTLKQVTPSPTSPSFISSTTSLGGPRKRIARVPNVEALLNEKAKIKKMQEDKRKAERDRKSLEESSVSSSSHTVSHTVAKGGKRVAHVPSLEVIHRPIVNAVQGSKVPQNVRQRYLNSFVEECLKFCQGTKSAYSAAVAEEKVCYSRATTRMVYLNLAVNTLKRLRTSQISDAAQEIMAQETGGAISDTTLSSSTSDPHPINPNHSVKSHFTIMSGGGQKGSWSIEKSKKMTQADGCDPTKGPSFYKHLKAFIMSEEDLENNGYPRPDPHEKGKAVVMKVDSRKKVTTSPTERYCSRCGSLYKVDKWGFPLSTKPCVHHWGRAYKQRGVSGFDTRYSCCQGDRQSEGCAQAVTHVCDNFNPGELRGYVRTIAKDPGPSGSYEVYALDCEMCYTTAGTELTRVTVVDLNCEVMYESLVRPDNPIIDYNTRFSGITETQLDGVKVNLRDVQAALMTRFSNKTILIGHSLESDLHALKLIHDTVVDTSIVFPHKMGPPFKRALRNLASEYLKKIIQNDDGGHDSAEDAIACMQLMIYKVKENLKMAKL